MIVCPNCNHQNPEGAVNCEACYTDLPSMVDCPHCGASILSDAVFCGNCGNTVKPATVNLSENDDLETPASTVTPVVEAESSPPVVAVAPVAPMATVLQSKKTAKLLHTQTSTMIDIPDSLSSITLGKPNEQCSPDIDVSGFPNSEIVSRIHARLIVEDNNFYLEDLGSSNGTYINHLPLLRGDRHLLEAGDHIALGKEDKVTFILEME
jgi:ribosomal protein L40E